METCVPLTKQIKEAEDVRLNKKTSKYWIEASGKGWIQIVELQMEKEKRKRKELDC